MATKRPTRSETKGTTSTVDINVRTSGKPEAKREPKTREDVAEARETFRVLRDASEGSKAKVTRFDVVTGEETFCGEFAAKLVSKAWISERFGGAPNGAEYVIEVWKPKAKGTGGFDYAGRARFRVDKRVIPTAIEVSTPAGDVSGLISQQIETTRKFNEMLLDTLKTVRDGSKASAIDWVGLAGAIAPIVVALIRRRGGPDPMELALQIAEAMRPEGGGDDLDAFVDRIAKLKEAGEALGLKAGDGANSDDVLSTVNRGIDVVGRLFSGNGARRRIPGADRPAAGDPLPTDADDDNLPESSAEPEDLNAWQHEIWEFRPYVPQYVNFPPRKAAEFLVGNVSDEVWDALVDDVGPIDDDKLDAWISDNFDPLRDPAWSDQVAAWFAATSRHLVALARQQFADDAEAEASGGAAVDGAEAGKVPSA